MIKINFKLKVISRTIPAYQSHSKDFSFQLPGVGSAPAGVPKYIFLLGLLPFFPAILLFAGASALALVVTISLEFLLRWGGRRKGFNYCNHCVSSCRNFTKLFFQSHFTREARGHLWKSLGWTDFYLRCSNHLFYSSDHLWSHHLNIVIKIFKSYFLLY